MGSCRVGHDWSDLAAAAAAAAAAVKRRAGGTGQRDGEMVCPLHGEAGLTDKQRS